MIASLYANSAFDESKEGIKSRQERIKGIEQHFNKAVELIYNPELHKEAEIDWTNPFWQAARRSQQRMLERVKGEGSVVEVAPETERLRRPDYDQI